MAKYEFVRSQTRVGAVITDSDGLQCTSEQFTIDFLDIENHKVEEVRGDHEVWSLPD